MLHLFEIEIAVAGLIQACFAGGGSKTAQRQRGVVWMSALPSAQQAGGTLARASLAAPRQGLKLAAADRMVVPPHSPATFASQT
ncbi:hypothetical protein NL676_038045 [Syzygium grande]|nr:hypothetical protein NL676_038045 [Syzygium grande]